MKENKKSGTNEKKDANPKRDLEFLKKNFKGLRKVDLESSGLKKDILVKFAFSY